MGSCVGSGMVRHQVTNAVGETNIALIGASGHGKTSFCTALSKLYGNFSVPQDEKDGTCRFSFELELEGQKERVSILSTSGQDIMERTKMGLFGLMDVFFIFIAVNSENRQFIKDNLVDIYAYFDKLKKSQRNGLTYLVATKVDIRKTDKDCVTEAEIKEMFTEKLGKKAMTNFLYYEVSATTQDGIDVLTKTAVKNRRLEKANQLTQS